VKLQEELPDLLAKYGLVAPDIFPEGTDTVGLESFFQWLCACVAMVEAGVHFHEDISAVVAVRTLSAAVYGLFPAKAGAPGGVTKAQLRSLHGANFHWPSEEAVRPETLPPLVKNISKNFMDHFFKGEGRAIVRREVERMKLQVISFFVVNLLCYRNMLTTSGWCLSASGQGQCHCGANPQGSCNYRRGTWRRGRWQRRKC